MENYNLDYLLETVPWLQDHLKFYWDTVKPWGEFFNRCNLSVPSSYQVFLERLNSNLSYFLGNYMIISTLLIAYCLFTTPMFLSLISFTLMGCFILYMKNRQKQLVIFGREITIKEQFIALAIMLLPLYFCSGVGQLALCVLGVVCLIILLHAGFYERTRSN